MIDRYIDRYIFTTKQQEYQETWPIWESPFHETPMGLILGIIIAGPDLLNFDYLYRVVQAPTGTLG